MPRRAKGDPSAMGKTFSFQHQSYALPNMNTLELTKVQPNELMEKLRACNDRLPPEKASMEFASAAFHILLRRFKGLLTGVERRQTKQQWKTIFRANKFRPEKEKSSTPGIERNSQCRDQLNIVIQSQNWWIPRQYDKNFRSLGFQRFGTNFISINPNHPRQDFTPSVLKQAFNAYVVRFPNVSLEIRQEVMRQKNSKSAQRFLKECGRLAAEAKVRAELKAAANCSTDSSSSDSETESDATETRDATDSSDRDDEDGMQHVVPAVDSSSASTCTETETEDRTIQSSSEDDGDRLSTSSSSESEVATQEVINESHEQVSERSSEDSNHDKMSLDNYNEHDNARSRKRRRKSTSPPSLHYPIRSQDTHPPRAKTLRMAKSSSPTRNSPSSTEQYGPGRDIFSALMDYLDQFR